MNRKQFLFTKDKGDFSYLYETHKIGDYYLYLGKDSDYCFVKKENEEFHLLGSMYDWENPHFSNKQILEIISQYIKLEDILRISDKYCGEFAIIIKLGDRVYIFNDACGQKEVYYNNKFTCFGTQPKLLGLVTDLIEHDDKDAKEYYTSHIFKTKCLFVGNTTHKSNIFHLLPNHYLDINKKKSIRFFPLEKQKLKPLEDVAKICSKMLKGYISAISTRNKIKMAVTGGYDSRVLFLASLNVECMYFVARHPYMDDSHHDIYVPKLLTKYFNRDFKIIDDKKDIVNIRYNYINDIDFPRFINVNKDIKFIYINGNISEIARNYYGYLKNATANDMCFIYGNSTYRFPIRQYHYWLKNKPVFKKYGYHYLDLFYWEEKMGNWAAKSKTENHALGRDVLSPFNSRELLRLLLSTKRIYRDSHFNKLYDLIIYELSGMNKEIQKIPINPCRKQKIIRIMKYLYIYNLYKYVGIKTKKLKV